YLFDGYAYLNANYPPEIHSPYICYIPKEQSGVLGVHAGSSAVPPLTGKSILPPSEISDYWKPGSSGIYSLPLYRYHIHDSIISFHRMTQEERIAATTRIFSALYNEARWSRDRLYIPSVIASSRLKQDTVFDDQYYLEEGLKVEPDVQMIFLQRYVVSYKYLIGRDTLSWYNKRGIGKNYLANIPMFYLPLDTNVYYKKNMRKYLVKKRLGFLPSYDRPEYNHLADYRHEIDTALLALPIRIFQEKYMQTKELYCLDEVSVHINRYEE
ncbi:MAG: hypothetical protein LBB84_04375, partial [Tannerellaceae bacterium]|nr:hypothetical protein [Tannerellaceae bacterium]